VDISEKPSGAHPWGDADTPYDELGGDGRIRRLVERFYDEIEVDSPVLRAMLPRSTAGSRQKLFDFLVGWTGGPQLYVEKHGHPRLRMRHLPFHIDQAAAAEWMRCMIVALDEVVESEPLRDFLTAQLAGTAHHLINAE
jgi:hemoglobin